MDNSLKPLKCKIVAILAVFLCLPIEFSFSLDSEEVSGVETKVVKLSPDFLLSSMDRPFPEKNLIELQYEKSKINLSMIEENFETSFDSDYYKSSSDELGLSLYDSVTKEYSEFEATLNRKFRYGFRLKAGVGSTKITNNFITNSSKSFAQATLVMDLYKDFFGKFSRSKLAKGRYEVERSKIENEISTDLLKNTILKLYWSYVANNEALKITDELLKTSQVQLGQVKKKYQRKVADKGELARYQSQAIDRDSIKILLEYDRTKLQQSFYELFPDLNDKEIALADYNLDSVVNQLLACAQVVSLKTDLPLADTSYDEFIELIKEEGLAQEKVDKSYSDVDFQLTAKYSSTARDYSNAEAFSDLSSDGQPSYSIGLSLSIPLEGKKSTTEEIMKKMNQKYYGIEKTKKLTSLISTHKAFLKKIKYLTKVIQNQGKNNVHLDEALKSSKQKYQQARISSEQYLAEQDKVFQSRLHEVDTKLVIMHTFLDYFSIFPKTNCEINRLKNG